MIAANQSVFRRYAQHIPNAAVLIVLVSIAAWGHQTHWKIPKFSEVFGKPGAGRNVSDVDANERPKNEPSTATGNTPTTTPEHTEGDGAAVFPPIRYAAVEAVEKAGISIDAVQERRMDEFVTAYGTVGYDEALLAQLSCRVSGIIWKVSKKLGDPVKKGDVLAIIDAADVGRAKAELLSADVDYDLKAQHLKRLKVITSSITERQLREAEAEVRKASVRRFNARQSLINMGMPISVQDIEGLSDDDLARRLHFLGLPPEIASHLDIDTESANLIPLVSPLQGIVTQREVVTGELVEPSKVQFVVADVRKMWLTLNVRKADAAHLAVGQQVYFSLTGVPDEISSKLSWISTEVDPKTRNVQVRAEVDNRPVESQGEAEGSGGWLLRSGMFGTGRIRIRQRPAILVVPSPAVQWDGVRHLVFVPQDDGVTFLPRCVELGIARDGFTEIRKGLTLGQPVVSGGSYVLKSELVGVDN